MNTNLEIDEKLMDIPKILNNLEEYVNSEYLFYFIDKYWERTRRFKLKRWANGL